MEICGATSRSGFPLSPIDSVGCHSQLKELRAGALGLEATVAALAQGDATAGGGAHPSGSGAAVPSPGSDAPITQDLFAGQPPHKGDFKLSLRGMRGLRRSRSLAGGAPTRAATEG